VETLMAFPPIHPDLAVIHVLRADLDGNAQIGDNRAMDEELLLASSQVILTAEEIVDELPRADLLGAFVQGVVHLPRGAAPTSCHPLYPLDGEALLTYTETVSDPPSCRAYLENF
jgi:glutaconate CoA-transferase subunit A